MNCQTVQENLTLYFYEELGAEERAALEAHLGVCPACREAAAELGRLRAVLDQRPGREPSPELLVRCRQALEDALDREAGSWRAMVRGWFVVPPGVSALRVTTGLTVLLVGFSLGWTLRSRTASPEMSGGAQPNQFVGADLADMRIRGISQVAPGPQTGQVRITLDAERRVTLEGSFDDDRIRDVLLYAVKSYDNPGIRRDTLEVLRGGVENPSVQEALLYALEHDSNPGMRLEAVEVARGMHCSADLHRALLEIAEQDTNPGVRFAAIDLLIQHALEEKDERLLRVLEKWSVQDRNPYVRLKCAKAARQLGQEGF